MADKDNSYVKTWKKRWVAAQQHYKDWATQFEVERCYNYWLGDQAPPSPDENGRKKTTVNKIHPEVRNNIPSIYYYRPYARLTAAPEYIDDPGTQTEVDTQVLQDTANHLIRDREVQFRDATFLGLKEAHWAMGMVEVGYSAEFVDAPTAEKPDLKEKKDTKLPPKMKEEAPVPELGMVPPEMGMAPDLMAASPDLGMETGSPLPPELADPMDAELAAIEAELAGLQESMKDEKFYVKHIPSNRVLISESDMPILENNDWVGYWEDVPLEDVKKSPAYKNKKDLKAATGDAEDNKRDAKHAEESGAADKVRLYKIWDLRSKTRWVFAEGHDKELLRKPYKRCPLKFLRFDVDPYHFLPRPLLLSKLGPQDEYNDSREYLAKIRRGTVPRYTYDEDGIDAKQLQKLESGEMGTYVPRRAGTSNVIEPINQPSFSENAIQTLTLSDKEFADVGGVGGDAKVASTKTATQAKIAETKSQVQDNFDRLVVAEWLSEIVRELLALAIENMSQDRWVAMNVAPDVMYSNPEAAAPIAATYQRINSQVLSEKTTGVTWDVVIDIDSISPVSEEEKFQKWMQGIQLLGNPVLARLFSVSPPLLQQTLKYMGMRSANDQALIFGAMQAVVQMEAQLAAQGQNSAPGVSPQAGSAQPGGPKAPGGPQPGGPPGPGASTPKTGAPPRPPAQ